jgi:hypothetical protein
MKRILLLSTAFLAFFYVISISQNVFAESAKKSPAKKKIQQLPSLEVSPAEVFDNQSLRGLRFEERFLNLGVDQKFTVLERDLIKVQVKNFIPPLLVPAIGNHAFVLPPGLFQIATSFKFVNVRGEDWYKNGEIDPAHGQNPVTRRFLTTSIRYGFDLDKKYFHSFTAVLNVTYENSESSGMVTLPDIGNGAKRVHNGGASEGIQDLNLMIKKKLWDQGNKPIGWAIAAGVYFPTGSTDEMAGDDGVICVTDTCTRATFKRFGNGHLPAGRQLGTGQMSYKIGTFFTRQLLPGDLPSSLAGTKFDRAALHWGATYRFNFENNGMDRGDKATIFGSAVVPVYKDYASIQFSSVSMWQQMDTYEGNFKFPNGTNWDPRPDFRGGWLSLVGPSLIVSPDPIVRMTFSYLKSVVRPAYGASPPWVANIGMSFVF